MRGSFSLIRRFWGGADLVEMIDARQAVSMYSRHTSRRLVFSIKSS